MNSSPFTVEPSGAALGADVTDVDVAAAVDDNDPAFFDAIRAAIAERLVLRFAAQPLSPDQLIRFAGAFGSFQNLKRTNNPDAHHVAGHDTIKVISNAVAGDGRPLGDGNAAEQWWHTDGRYLETPPAYTFFYCRKTPSPAPRTFWMNMARVYEELPDAWKREIADLRAIHARAMRSNERAFHEGLPERPLDVRQDGPQHPLVRLVPETGRAALFLPTPKDSLIVGRTPQESRQLLNRLWGFVETADAEWGAAMQPDDLVMWDNRATVHRREGWDATQERVMWHLSVVGEIPVPFARAA